MVISSELDMEYYRDEDHREDAPHFKILKFVLIIRYGPSYRMDLFFLKNLEPKRFRPFVEKGIETSINE